MKKGFSIEFKIIFAATVVMLAFFTAVIGVQIFKNDSKKLTFVYNSRKADIKPQVNICDIFEEA